MKYILLLALMYQAHADYFAISSTCINGSGQVQYCNNKDKLPAPYYEHTPVMLGGLFDTEKECMERAKVEYKTAKGFCMPANGWDKKAQDDTWTPYKEVK